MKVCCRCKCEKPEDEFNKKSANKDGLERYCKVCHKQKNKQHYESNKDKYVDSALKFKQELREWFRLYKSSLCCIRCGETKPWRLAFHHRDPSQKESSVSALVSHHASRDAILVEIEKCDVVCHNCHADIHHEQDYNE